MKTLPRYTFGMGDRFGRQGAAQLDAVIEAQKAGIDISPVWNKSHREHSLTKTQPPSLRAEADRAVAENGYTGPYFVDADHVNLETIEDFVACSDFFTLDVARDLNGPLQDEEKEAAYRTELMALGTVVIEGLESSFHYDADTSNGIVRTYGSAVRAGKSIYRYLCEQRPAQDFAIELSIDETETAQQPMELLGLLVLLALEGVPVQTIAPKFSGRFNKGVDYTGDLAKLRAEFEADLLVLRYCTERFELPSGLKLSVHSGSDKFSIYPIIRELVQKHDAGLHLKTAGTTWLEEILGVVEGGEDGLEFAIELYLQSLKQFEVLTGPYATVLDIDPDRLPSAESAAAWDRETFLKLVDHEQEEPLYNPDLRQLLHVSFKLAAQDARFDPLLVKYRETIHARVKRNLLKKHIQQIYPICRP